MNDVLLELLNALRWAMKSGDACRCLSGAVCTGHQAIKKAEEHLGDNRAVLPEPDARCRAGMSS